MNKSILLILCVLGLCGRLSAQSLTDDFADGNHTANPTWLGNTADFTVNTTVASPSFQLQLQAVVNTSTPRYLSVPAQTSLADSTTWEFYSFQNFPAASTNYGRVYLASSSSDLTGSLNGYYVRLGGHTGAVDSLELFRQTGLTSTKICGGVQGAMGGTTTTASVRVTRNTAGEWRLLADYTGGTNYVLQSTGTDNTHASGQFAGVNCIFTTTRSAHFYFDNFYISPLFVDAQAPNLLSATAATASTVVLQFSEALDAGSATNLANYSFSGGLGATAAMMPTAQSVSLTLTPSLTSGTQYQVTVTGVQDLATNAMGAQSANFTYFNVQPAVYGDIIISEIMADPDPIVGLPNVEWVELHNRSNKYIDLQNFVFNEGSARILPAQVIAPNSYILLTLAANRDSLTAFGTVLGLSGMGLTNAGELLTLSDAGGAIIDSVTYSDAWYIDAAKRNGGWTLEIINPALGCKGSSNWIASTAAAGGTPNAQNSVFSNTPDNTPPSLLSATFTNATTLRLVFDDVLSAVAAQNTANYSLSGGLSATNAQFVSPSTVILTLSPAMMNQSSYTVTVGSGLTDCVGNAIGANNSRQFAYYDVLPAQEGDLIFNELMIDPDPVVALPNHEYIELYNRAAYAINLQGLLLTHISSSSGAATLATLGDYTLLPNDYVILHASSGTAELSLITPKHIEVASFPALNNTSARLSLRRGSITIDTLTYIDELWYKDSNKDEGGWSLELINPNHLCKEGDNWRAALNAAGGTPGALNSANDLTPDQNPPVVISVRPISATQIVVETNKILDPSSVGDLNNYNTTGGINILTATIGGQRDIVFTLAAPMQHQSTYSIIINGAEDCLDNPMFDTATVTYYETEAATHYDIIINEIFPDTDPQVGLPLKEYIELYNRSTKYINLQGFTFQDGSSAVAELPYYVMPPNSYLVVASNSDTIAFSQFGNYLLVEGFPDMNVSNDEAILRDFLGNVIDAVAYEQAWYGNSNKAAGGWSLERINPNRPCEAATNWIASENPLGGSPAQANSVLQTTPDNTAPELLRAFPIATNRIRLYFSEAISDADGVVAANYTLSALSASAPSVLAATIEMPFYNSVVLILADSLQPNTIYTLTVNSSYRDCIGTTIAAAATTARIALPQTPEANDLVINEVLFNPVTGGSDFVELYNKSSKVINARSLLFANTTAMGTINQVQALTTDFLIFPNDYIVITPSPEHLNAQYTPQNPVQMLKNSLPTYADDESTVLLYTTAGSVATTIDQLTYSDEWHHPMLADDNGVSLERISIEQPTQDQNNWHSGASAVGYATPTYQNSSARTAEVSNNIIDIPTPTFSPDGDGFEDFLLIYYQLESLGFVARIYVYDAQGRLVRRLSDGELFAQTGQIQWDGATDLSEKAGTGIYIIDIELTNPTTGKIERLRRTCVVASRL